jgi:phytoene synthase
VTERVQASGTSFYWAMRVLPQAKRLAMYGIYAFAREIDDIADEPASRDQKSAALAAWRAEIDALYAGKPNHPIAVSLLAPVRHFDLQRDDFLAVIDGMEMDADGDIQAPTMAELELYCDRVACAVGRLSVKIFGIDGPAGIALADALGRALQLTNILRDLAEDAARHRLYLPRELLAAHGIATRDPAAVLRDPALPHVCRALARVAEDHFAAAAEAMAGQPRRAVRPPRIMHAVYHATLKRLKEDDWQHLEPPVKVPTLVKLGLVLRHGLL